jgi:hypothetical protein
MQSDRSLRSEAKSARERERNNTAQTHKSAKFTEVREDCAEAASLD